MKTFHFILVQCLNRSKAGAWRVGNARAIRLSAAPGKRRFKELVSWSPHGLPAGAVLAGTCSLYKDGGHCNSIYNAFLLSKLLDPLSDQTLL